MFRFFFAGGCPNTRQARLSETRSICAKSTGAANILPKRFSTGRFLNADDIARALATDSRIEAGRVMIRRMNELRERRETFAFETTLVGKTHAGFLQEAQNAGYRIHIGYLWLSVVELAKKRVAAGVQEGGQDVVHELDEVGLPQA